jgi:hypothetical protein
MTVIRSIVAIKCDLCYSRQSVRSNYATGAREAVKVLSDWSTGHAGAKVIDICPICRARMRREAASND